MTNEGEGVRYLPVRNRDCTENVSFLSSTVHYSEPKCQAAERVRLQKLEQFHRTPARRTAVCQDTAFPETLASLL